MYVGIYIKLQKTQPVTYQPIEGFLNKKNVEMTFASVLQSLDNNNNLAFIKLICAT